jgi:hypothetical protein
MPFGTVFKIPAVSIDLVGNATLMDSIGLHDPKLDADLQNLLVQQLYTQGYANALITAGSALKTNASGVENSFLENPNDPDFQQGESMMQNGFRLLQETAKMQNDIFALRQQLA